MRKNELFRGIDIFKFLASLMVVAIHTGLPYNIEVLCRVAVPFFFISSSFLFYNREKSYKDFAKRLGILYLVWFLIELPIVIQRFSGQSFLVFLRGLLFSNTFYASWFIIALIEALGLCVLLSKRLSNVHLLIIGFVLYSLSLLGGGYYGLVSGRFKSFIDTADSIIPLTNSFITAFLYVVLGKVFYELKPTLKNLSITHPRIESILLVSSVVVFVLETIIVKPIHRFSDTFILLPVLAFLFLDFATGFNPPIKKGVCSFLRKSSILIYLLHPIILSLLPRFQFNSIILNLVARYSCAVGISIILSGAIILGAKKWRPLSYLF